MIIREFSMLEYEYTKCPSCGSYTPIWGENCCDCHEPLEIEQIHTIEVTNKLMDMYYYVNKPELRLMIQMVYVTNNEGCAIQPVYFYDMEYEYGAMPEVVLSHGFKRNGPSFVPTGDYSRIDGYFPPYEYFSGCYNYKQHRDFIYVVDKVYPCELPGKDTFDLKTEGWRGPIEFSSDGSVKVYTATGRYKRYGGYIKIDYDHSMMYEFDNMNERALCISEEYLIEVEEGLAYCFFANKNGLKSLGISLEKGG